MNQQHFKAAAKVAIILALLFLATSCQKFNSINIAYQRVIGHDNRPLGSQQFCDTLHFPYHRDTVTKYYNNMPDNMPDGRETPNADGTRDYYFYNKVVSVNGQYGVKTAIKEPDFKFFQTTN